MIVNEQFQRRILLPAVAPHTACYQITSAVATAILTRYNVIKCAELAINVSQIAGAVDTAEVITMIDSVAKIFPNPVATVCVAHCCFLASSSLTNSKIPHGIKNCKYLKVKIN